MHIWNTKKVSEGPEIFRVSLLPWFKITERDDQSSEIISFAQMSLTYTAVQVNEGEKKIYLSIYYIKVTA